MNKNRLEAFSDGVLAIIITIMVLEFKIPKNSLFFSVKTIVANLFELYFEFHLRWNLLE